MAQPIKSLDSRRDPTFSHRLQLQPVEIQSMSSASDLEQARQEISTLKATNDSLSRALKMFKDKDVSSSSDLDKAITSAFMLKMKTDSSVEALKSQVMELKGKLHGAQLEIIAYSSALSSMVPKSEKMVALSEAEEWKHIAQASRAEVVKLQREIKTISDVEQREMKRSASQQVYDDLEGNMSYVDTKTTPQTRRLNRSADSFEDSSRPQVDLVTAVREAEGRKKEAEANLAETIDAIRAERSQTEQSIMELTRIKENAVQQAKTLENQLALKSRQLTEANEELARYQREFDEMVPRTELQEALQELKMAESKALRTSLDGDGMRSERLRAEFESKLLIDAAEARAKSLEAQLEDQNQHLVMIEKEFQHCKLMLESMVPKSELDDAIEKSEAAAKEAEIRFEADMRTECANYEESLKQLALSNDLAQQKVQSMENEMLGQAQQLFEAKAELEKYRITVSSMVPRSEVSKLAQDIERIKREAEAKAVDIISAERIIFEESIAEQSGLKKLAVMRAESLEALNSEQRQRLISADAELAELRESLKAVVPQTELNSALEENERLRKDVEANREEARMQFQEITDIRYILSTMDEEALQLRSDRDRANARAESLAAELAELRIACSSGGGIQIDKGVAVDTVPRSEMLAAVREAEARSRDLESLLAVLSKPLSLFPTTAASGAQRDAQKGINSRQETYPGTEVGGHPRDLQQINGDHRTNGRAGEERAAKVVEPSKKVFTFF